MIRETELSHDLADVSRRMLTDERDQFIVDLFATLQHELPEMVSDPWITALLEASVTENVVSIVNFLESGVPVENLDATSGALTHARITAQREIPLASLIRAYRIGHSLFLRMALPIVLESSSGHHAELAQLLVGRSGEFIDKVCQQVSEAHDSERDRWFGNRGARRHYWVNEVLSGHSIDVAEAETNLGYRFSGSHLGVQMWLHASESSDESRMQFENARRTVGELLEALGSPLVLPRDERQVHVWFPVPRDIVVPLDELSRKLTVSAGSQVHVAVGRPGQGISGFRTTMSEAQRVKDLLLVSSNPSPAVTTYDALGPVALMTGNVDLLRQYVARTLKDLALPGERETTLRDTLRMFLSLNRSFAATAEELFLHRNSVQYRVQQALEHCGRELAEPDAALELQTALNIVHWLGSAVLREPEPSSSS